MRATKDMIALLIRKDLCELKAQLEPWETVYQLKEDYGPDAAFKGDPIEKAILRLARLRELRWEWKNAPSELTLGNRP